MKTCIICRNEKAEEEFNEEHMIPDSLGGTLTMFDICKECNSSLGNEVDVHLTNNLLSEIHRFFLGIKGKSGKLPNPFKQGEIINDEDGGRVVCNEKLQPKLIGKVIDDEKSEEFIVIASSEKEAYELMRKKLKRKYSRNFTDEEIKSMIKEHQSKVFQPEIKCPIKKIDFNSIELAIIKIAYEFTYYWLGKNYLNDIQGKVISDMLLNSIRKVKVNKPHDTIGKMPNLLKNILTVEYISRIFNKKTTEINLDAIHFVQLHKKDNNLYCNISLFGDFNYWVLVSKNACGYLNTNKTFIALADIGEYIFQN